MPTKLQVNSYTKQARTEQIGGPPPSWLLLSDATLNDSLPPPPEDFSTQDFGLKRSRASKSPPRGISVRGSLPSAVLPSSGRQVSCGPILFVRVGLAESGRSSKFSVRLCTVRQALACKSAEPQQSAPLPKRVCRSFELDFRVSRPDAIRHRSNEVAGIAHRYFPRCCPQPHH